ncbi:serine/threonine-protein kinase MRCK beta-like [Sycon ciliatum]|uniref:serine/threonine-protein kinase MRCK beta-like n=1 Tax=Sycon ciliatum TaxID=27933 RepID=UPI0020ADEA29|eukprot:scpid8792/ scgid31797/ Serine/threonine-protein kinase MRCK alpha; CDC42-binding protein kinase alpha; Myotonic dystrophy kinase-related CDC42-binding kinase alpha
MASPSDRAAVSAKRRTTQLEGLYLDAKRCKPEEALSVDGLLDALLVLHDECSGSTLRKDKNIENFVSRTSECVTKVKNLRMRKEDFETLRVIGKGAFGQVQLVRLKETSNIYAMKILNKWDMLKRQETACFREERDVLVYGDSRWLTQLHFAFQDVNYLYLVMEYYIGGDLLTLLSRFDDRLDEQMAKFYFAEMILAINCVHELGYLHRDIKPDNLLLDRHGHLHLADFGSCLRLDENGMVSSPVAVGTPDYISPEILRAMEDGKGNYGVECDWWSFGIVAYEVLIGETPFYAESLVETYGKIMNYKTQFAFPEDVGTDEASETVRNLIHRLICDKKERLGNSGVKDFKAHPFFEGVDWDKIHLSRPPYVPEVEDDADTSHFDEIEVSDGLEALDAQPNKTVAAFTGHHLPFVGFTYIQNSRLSDKHVSPLNDGASDGQVEVAAPVETAERGMIDRSAEIDALHKEIQDLQAQVEEANREMEEAERLNEQRQLEQREYADDTDHRITVAEQTVKKLSQESERLQSELRESQDSVSSLRTELKENQQQRRALSVELNEISDRLNQVKSQKTKLSRIIHEREEDLEKLASKLDNVKADKSALDKKRRELVTELEEAEANLAKEKNARAKAEQSLQALLNKEIKAAKSTNSEKTENELARVRSDLDKSRSDYEEALEELRSKHGSEASKQREEIVRLEEVNRDLTQEAAELQNKMLQAQKEAQIELDEKLAVVSSKLEGEKTTLLQDNDELKGEMEKLTQSLERSIAYQQQLEKERDEAEQKKEQDSVSHWETQISEIVQWVNDERDARGYLQALARKMTEELDSVKQANSSARDWQMRKSVRQNKQEILTLQASLQTEVAAKEQLDAEVTKLKSHLEAYEQKLAAADANTKELLTENERMAATMEAIKQQNSVSGHTHSTIAEGNRRTSYPSDAGFPHVENITYSEMNADQAAISVNTPSTSSTASAGKSVARVSSDAHSTSSTSTTPSTSRAPNPSPSREPSTHSTNSSSSDVSAPVHAPLRGHVKTLAAEFSNHESRSNSVSSHDRPRTNKDKNHRFTVKTFSVPTKCQHCTSVMIGLVRQGMVCDSCKFSVHTHCAQQVELECPVSQELLMKAPRGMDPERGIGTVCEGWVKVPKPGGVKRGWTRHYAVVCDLKVFLYEFATDRASGTSIAHVFDIRDPNFSVSSVQESDVIHAPPRLIPSIFKISVTAHSTSDGTVLAHVLVLTDTEGTKKYWLNILQELMRVLKAQKSLGGPTRFGCTQLYTAQQVDHMRVVHAADIIDHNHIVLAVEEGLYLVETPEATMIQVGEKRAIAVEVMHKVMVIAAITGRNHHLRLYGLAALEGADPENAAVKVDGTRGCVLMTTGFVTATSTAYVAVAVKRKILVYEVVAETKTKATKIKEINVASTIHTLTGCDGHLAVGSSNDFTLYSVTEGETAAIALIDREDPGLSFVIANPGALQCIACIELTPGAEYLLCFNMVGVFVSGNGCRSRSYDLNWPSSPQSIAFQSPHLLVCTVTSVEVYDTRTGDWMQSSPLKRCSVLNRFGSLMWCLGMDPPRILHFQEERDDMEVNWPPPRHVTLLSQKKRKIQVKFNISTDERVPTLSTHIDAPAHRDRTNAETWHGEEEGAAALTYGMARADNELNTNL